MRPDSIIPLVTGPLGSLFSAFGTLVETSQFGAVLGVLLGLVGVVLLALVASLLGWGIVALLARSTYVYNPRTSPAADSELRAEPVGVTAFFSFAALGSVLGSAASSVSTAASAVVSAIASNLLFIAIVVLLFAFIFVWDAWMHLFIHAFAEFEANFFLGFWRSVPVPLSAVVAFIADMAAVVLDGVRHVVQAGTVVTIEKSLICGFGALQVIGLQAFATFNASILATEQWLRVNGTDSALTRGPDFFPTGVALGQTIASTQTLFDCACQPLSDRLFAPLAVPFTQPAFARALNATLGIPAALVTQVIFRPVAVSIQRAFADPTTNLSVDVVPPSFNASLDLLAFAITNATLFLDSFVPALDNTTTLFLEDLLGVPLPGVLPPQAGLLTAFIGGPADVIIQVAKDVLNLVTNAIFNADQVFASDGFLFWRLDDAFEALKRAILIVEGYLLFIAEWLRELGAILAANVRKRGADYAPVRALAHLPQAAVGAALQQGFDLAATFVDTIRCYVDGLLVQFAIPLGQLAVDLVVGTIYRAVTTTIANGFPNPLAYAQELWGDDTSFFVQCGDFDTFPDLFHGQVTGCLAIERFARLCVGVANDTQLRTEIAGFSVGSSFGLFESTCLGTHVRTCAVVGSVFNGVPGNVHAGVPVADNKFIDVLDGILTTSQCTSTLFDNLCTGCGIFGVFLGRPLVNVLVQAVILPLNILIHLDLVVTTEYLGTCVDFDTPLSALEDFFIAVGQAVDLFNLQLTGTACPVQSITTTTVDVGSATIICAAGGVIEFGGITVVEFARQVAIAFRTVIVGITALAGVVGTEDFLNILGQIDFSKTLANAEVTILDATALLLSIFIPASFNCQPDPTMPGVPPSNVRTAFVNALGTLAADALLLIPRVVLIGLTTIIKDLTMESTGAVGVLVNVVGDLFAAVLTPVLGFIGDAFIQFGKVLDCLTAANAISSVFIAIGNFLHSDTLITGIQLVVELFTDAIAFVFGVIQVIVTLGSDTTLLEDSLDLFKTLAGDLFILIFGVSTACGIQSFICSIPFIGNVSFITAQCTAQGHPTSCASAIQSSGGTCISDTALCGTLPIIPLGGACPSSPFGCCSTIPGFPAAGSFPVINDAAFSSCQPGQFCDERFSCEWNLPVDANNVATIPFEPTAPAGNPDAALGQSIRDALFRNCPRFANLTDCVNPGLLNSDGTPFSHGEIARARPFGLHMALDTTQASGQATGQLLNFDYCMRVVEAYGRARAEALFAPLRHLNGRMSASVKPDLLAQMRATPALVDLWRCYIGLYPEWAPRVPSPEEAFARRASTKASAFASDSMASRMTAYLLDLRQRGTAIYERNRVRYTAQSTRRRISPLARYAPLSAAQMQLAARFRSGRAALARGLASMQLSHDADQRARERKLTTSFFDSFSDWYRERRRRANALRYSQYGTAAAGGSVEEGLAPQLVALVLHFSEAVEHIGYALHYHLNLRPVGVDVFGMPVRSHAEHAALAARPRPALDDALRVPHPLEVVRLWALERQQHASQRIHESLRNLLTSANYAPPAPMPIRWHQVVYLRQSAARHRPLSQSRAIAAAVDARRYATYAVLPNDTSLEELLGVDQCNTGDQLFCTGCALLDNVVFAVEQQVNATIDFYTNDSLPNGGFAGILNQFETTIHNTLVDPVGPDTYTTANPRTPFILRRFLTIDWPWFWDYSEFRAIVYGANDTADTAAEAGAVGFSAREQTAIAASQNRTDADLATLNTTSIFVTPIISFLERLAFQVTHVGPLDTLIRLFERYIVCDYVRSMFGEEPHSTGLFDAIVITVLGLTVIGVFLSILPGVGMCAMMIYMMFAGLIFLTLVYWIGYGASPLCTLPSFFGGIPGVPVPFPTDLQRLFEELTPECPPINPGMIDPAAFAAASTQLCGQPGPVPPLVPCSQAAGFIDGFDNIFFMLTGLYGEAVTQRVGAELAPFAPEVAQVAAIYTDAHNAALAARFEVGALCNFLTIGNVLTVLVQLGLLVLAAVALVAVLILLIGLLLIAIVLGIYANFVIWLQVRKSFLAEYRRYGTKLKTQ